VADQKAKNQALKEGLDQLYETAKREQKMMSTAWFNLAMQLQKAKASGGASRPQRASWLGKRRLEAEQSSLSRPSQS